MLISILLIAIVAIIFINQNNQGHLNLKNDITKNISQSISGFSENENSSNITQKPIPSDVVPVYSVLDKN